MAENTAPYFDDYDPSVGYVKVLFKPEHPIQARELNTLQSQNNHQTKAFADHIYKNGARISNARMNAVQYSGLSVAPGTVVSFIEGWTLEGDFSGQQATFIKYVSGLNVLAVNMNGINTVSNTQSFSANELINVYDENDVLVTTIYASNMPHQVEVIDMFVIDQGVFYWGGYFVETQRQTCLIPNLTDTVVGYEVVSEIVTAATDPTLLDNNTNGSNLGAEGADRLKYSLVLRTKTLNGAPTDNKGAVGVDFIRLAEYTEGGVSYLKSDTEYGQIGDFVAQRTFEESGNYAVDDFSLSVIEHRATSAIGTGFSVDGLESNYVAQVSPGVAYVKGNRIEKTARTNVIAEKARDVKTIPSVVKQFEPLAYMLAIPRTSVWPNLYNSTRMNDESSILLYDNVLSGADVPTGSQIGTANVSDAVLYGQTVVGVTRLASGALETIARPIYKYYLSNVTMNSTKTPEMVKSLYHATASFAAEPYLEPISEIFKVFDTVNMEFIWPVGKQFVKSMRDADDPSVGSMSLTVRKKMTGVLASDTVTFRAVSGEYFQPLAASTLCIKTNAGVNVNVALVEGVNVAVTPTTFIVTLAGFNGHTITVITDVVKSNLIEKKKTLTTLTQVVTAPNDASTTLTKSDVVSYKVEFYDTATPTVLTNVTGAFRLFTGQTDDSYVNAVVTKVGALPMSVVGTSRLLITYQYFNHTGDEGFFNADSYSGVEYGTIPVYTSSTGKEFRLSDCLDFRPLVLSSVVVSNTLFPSFGQYAILDLSYYLPRIDYVVLTSEGDLKVIKGIADDQPIPMIFESDTMLLYTLSLAPYVFKLSDISIKKQDNRRYTMKDIAKLDSRLSNVEYYIALNLLEAEADKLAVKDVDGLDRFKNGFIVDDFSKFQAADLTSGEFRAAIDSERKHLRPSFIARSRKLVLDEAASSGVKLINGMAYLSYTSVVGLESKAATRAISVNPYYMRSSRGKVKLTPNVDNWADTTTTNVTVNVDTGMSAALQGTLDLYGKGRVIGEWVTSNSTITTR